MRRPFGAGPVREIGISDEAPGRQLGALLASTTLELATGERARRSGVTA